MNSIKIIFPYKIGNTFVFDDDETGLYQEPFVDNMGDIINFLIKKHKIKNSDKGFSIMFSDEKFPEYQGCLKWIKGEYSGNWYKLTENNMEGWLCSAMFHYFNTAPKFIYFKLKEV